MASNINSAVDKTSTECESMNPATEDENASDQGEFLKKDTPDGNKDSTSPVFGKEIKNVVAISLSFLFLFSSYMAIQSLQGSLNDEEGLGVLSLSCLYGASVLSCVFAPVITTVFGVKRSLLIAFGTHMIYTACNFYPSFATLIPSSILLGSFTGPLWSSQGFYMTTCAFSYARRTGVLVYTSLSKLNGIYYTVYNLSNIIGNLVSSLVLYQGHYNVTRLNSSSYCGVNDCPSNVTADLIADPEPRIVYILLGVFLGFGASAIAITAILLSPIPTQGSVNRKIIKDSALLWFKVLLKTDFKYLVPLTCYFAVSEEILFAEVTKSYVSCPIGIQNVGYVMMTYGVSSCLTSFAFIRLAKYTRRYIVFTVAAAIQMTLLVWIYHWVPTNSDTVYIYLLVSVWGVCEGLWKINNSSMIGEIFSEHIKAVFAVKEGFKSMAFTITFVYSSMLCVYVKLLIAMSFLVVAILMYYFVEFRFIQRQKRTRKCENEYNLDVHEIKPEPSN